MFNLAGVFKIFFNTIKTTFSLRLLQIQLHHSFDQDEFLYIIGLFSDKYVL